MNCEIKTYRFKYLVPFKYYSPRIYDDPYRILTNRLTALCKSADAVWKPSSAVLRAEQDVYRYILESFGGSFATASDNYTCSIWKYSLHSGKKIRYFNTKQENKVKYIDFIINRLDLFIFRNHIGILCYEITLLSQVNDLSDILEFQNSIKEFSYKDKSVRILVPVLKCSISSQHIQDTPSKMLNPLKLINQDNKTIWVDRSYLQEICDNPKVLSESEIIVNQRIKNVNSQRIVIYDSFNIGLWIDSILQDVFNLETISYSYFAHRKYEGVLCIPDKALLYSYLFIKDQLSEEDTTIFASAYCLANGYSDRYPVPDNIISEIFAPFKGTTWYASRQGCCCIVQSNKNVNFYETIFKSKVVNDYFYLYVLLLNHIYGLTYYAEMITKDLSADVFNYTRPNDEMQKKLSFLNAEVNLFLMKCTYVSVSSLQHQNDYYDYIKKQLGIEGDVLSVKDSLERLTVLQDSLIKQSDERNELLYNKNRDKKDRMLNLSLALLALLTVVSAIADAKTLFWDHNAVNALQHLCKHPFFAISLLLIIVVGMIVLGSILSTIYGIFDEHKNYDSSD